MSMAKLSEEYMSLIKRFPLRPISAHKRLEEALQVFNELLLADNAGELSRDEQDYMLVLGKLIKECEENSLKAISAVSPQRALKFLMKENTITQAELVPLVGHKSNLSAFLAGRRNLSKSAAVKLGERFNVDPALFLPRV